MCILVVYITMRCKQYTVRPQYRVHGHNTVWYGMVWVGMMGFGEKHNLVGGWG